MARPNKSRKHLRLRYARWSLQACCTSDIASRLSTHDPALRRGCSRSMRHRCHFIPIHKQWPCAQEHTPVACSRSAQHRGPRAHLTSAAMRQCLNFAERRRLTYSTAGSLLSSASCTLPHARRVPRSSQCCHAKRCRSGPPHDEWPSLSRRIPHLQVDRLVELVALVRKCPPPPLTHTPSPAPAATAATNLTFLTFGL